MKATTVLAFLFLICAALPLHAADLNDLTWTTTDGEVTITDCDEVAAGELVIPNTIEGNPVTSIWYEAFRNCTGLTGITIPASVTSIGTSAFVSCTSLTSITIPDGVTSIENTTFYKCTNLASVTLPDSVTSIGNRDAAQAGVVREDTPSACLNMRIFSSVVRRLPFIRLTPWLRCAD